MTAGMFVTLIFSACVIAFIIFAGRIMWNDTCSEIEQVITEAVDDAWEDGYQSGCAFGRAKHLKV